MNDGRTLWFPHDARWLGWDSTIQLGEEFGGDAVSVMICLTSEAKLQRAGWRVKAALRMIARDAFVRSVDKVRLIVVRAGEVGALDDVTIDDGLVECRISGMAATERKVRGALRQEAQRERDAALLSVTKREQASPTGEERTEEQQQHLSGAPRSDRAEPNGSPPTVARAPARPTGDTAAVWTAYLATHAAVFRTGSKPTFTAARRALIARRLNEHPAADLIDAVQGWQHFPHNRGENDRGTPFCSIELVLRDAAQIERFRDKQRQAGNPRSSAELAAAISKAAAA